MLMDIKQDVRFSFDGIVNDIHVYQFKPKLYSEVPNRFQNKKMSIHSDNKGSSSYIVYESYEE